METLYRYDEIIHSQITDRFPSSTLHTTSDSCNIYWSSIQIRRRN